jgi:hypothetical protein
MPDEPDNTEEQVEDLEPAAADVEQVKGGSSKNEVAIESLTQGRDASPQLGTNRGGWDGNHNQTLIEL